MAPHISFPASHKRPFLGVSSAPSRPGSPLDCYALPLLPQGEGSDQPWGSCPGFASPLETRTPP
jgi:hypothetical protein